MPARIKIGDLVKVQDAEFNSPLGLVVATGEKERPWFGGGYQIVEFFSVLWQDPLGDGSFIRRYDLNALSTGYIRIVGRTR